MRSGRLGAVAILALALIGYLRRRVWWSYAGGRTADRPARPAYITRQPAERTPYVARVTDDWRVVADRALPALRTGFVLRNHDALLPAVWFEAAGRPDVADLPRVTRDEPLRALTQWLWDAPTRRVILVVAAIEPVSCAFAVAFDARRDAETLSAAAEAEQLALVVGNPPDAAAQPAIVGAGAAASWLVLPLDAPGQLRAVLAELTIEN